MFKIITFIILLTSFCLGKDVHLFWNPNPQEDGVDKYCVLISEQPNILRTDVNGNYYYVYNTYSYTITPYHLASGIDETKTYYFVVVAHSSTSNSWSFPSKEVIFSTSNVLNNSLIVQRNPNTSLMEVVFTVSGNSGTYVAIQSTTDLVNWNVENLSIIDTGNNLSLIFPIYGPTKFYRTVKITSNNYQTFDPALFDVTIQSTLAISQPYEIITPVVEEPITTTRVKKKYNKEKYTKYLKSRKKKHGIH